MAVAERSSTVSAGVAAAGVVSVTSPGGVVAGVLPVINEKPSNQLLYVFPLQLAKVSDRAPITINFAVFIFIPHF